MTNNNSTHDDALDDAFDELTSGKTEAQGERIAKRLSRAGVCSRRKAEVLISEGRVSINGETIDTPAIRVLPEDEILVDGESIKKPEETRLWILHKPKGIVTTNSDPEGRETVFDLLPEDMPRVMSIGRLDLNSEGLLLLTNDGELARYMELPATGWTRRYRVRVHGAPNKETLRLLKKGLVIDDVHYGSISASIESETHSNCWLNVGLTEGKNREIRRVFEHFGHDVSRLIRVSYGPFQLGTMERGETKEVPRRVLRSQLGEKFFKNKK
ncbi:MAG: rRNA pseudouridine synthase [Alphaproteobacteria bacterium]|nr:rRNA pseudouridine synthase [Alphaproteobacteria bacterium]